MDRFQSESYAAYRHTDESPDFAANVCENCDRGSSSPLHYVPEYKMNACDVCYDEAMAILAEEAAEFAAALARIAAPRVCANCPRPARPDSLYCSDFCKTQYLSFTFSEVA